jgi:hypothetical protein
VRRKHLPGDLRVAWFVGADQAKLVTPRPWREAVQQEKPTEDQKDKELTETVTDLGTGSVPALP